MHSRNVNSDLLSSAFKVSAMSPDNVDEENRGIKDSSIAGTSRAYAKTGAVVNSFLSVAPGAGRVPDIAHCLLTEFKNRGGQGT